MTKKKLFVSYCALALLPGCATSGQNTLVGVGVGMLAGGIVGNLVDGGPRDRLRSRNTFIGSTVGGAVGATAAYFVHSMTEKKEENPDLISQKKTMELFKPKYTGGNDQPTLHQPKVEAKYIDDQVRGSSFVPGHLEYQIVEPARWSRD